MRDKMVRKDDIVHVKMRPAGGSVAARQDGVKGTLTSHTRP